MRNDHIVKYLAGRQEEYQRGRGGDPDEMGEVGPRQCEILVFAQHVAVMEEVAGFPEFFYGLFLFQPALFEENFKVFFAVW